MRCRLLCSGLCCTVLFGSFAQRGTSAGNPMCSFISFPYIRDGGMTSFLATTLPAALHDTTRRIALTPGRLEPLGTRDPTQAVWGQLVRLQAGATGTTASCPWGHGRHACRAARGRRFCRGGRALGLRLDVLAGAHTRNARARRVGLLHRCAPTPCCLDRGASHARCQSHVPMPHVVYLSACEPSLRSPGCVSFVSGVRQHEHARRGRLRLVLRNAPDCWRVEQRWL